MNLFKQVPSNFFSVLASPNKEIYLQALLTVYEAFQTDWSIPKNELVIFLIDQLDDLMADYNFDEGEDYEMVERTSSGHAHLVLRKLKDTGWIEIEMGTDDFKEYISIPDYAYKIMEVLHEIMSSNREVEYNRYVYSTYSVLKLSSEEQSNYQTAIYSAYDQTRTLFDKLKVLHNNIRRYHRQLADLHDMNQILTEHFNEFKENLADKIYHPIKTFDSVHRFKAPILAFLKKWLYSDKIMEILSEEAWIREKNKRSISERDVKEKAIESAQKKLVKTIDIYEHIDQLLREIDKKNTEYTRATLERIDFLLNTDRSVKGKVRELIKVLTADPSEKWSARISEALDISPQFILDEKSLYASKKSKTIKNTKREKVKERPDKDKILNEEKAFRHSVKNAFSKQAVEKFILELLDEAEQIQASEIPIKSDCEYVKTVLGVLDSDDKKSRYTIAFKKGQVNKIQYVIPDFTINRKAKNDS